MNIIKYELKRFIKPFIFWTIGLFVTLVLGMYKFEAIVGSGTSISDLMSSFPKIVLAIFGMSSLNIAALEGYYGVLFIYVIIIGAVYAINLGAASTALEINNKTADFIYSKPISRIKVLIYKNIAHIIYIIIFCLLSYMFTLISFMVVGADNNINNILILLHISLLVIMLIYYTFSAAVNAYSPKYGYLIAIIALTGDYLIYIIYEMLGYKFLQFLTPLKYFDISEVIKTGSISIVFSAISFVIITYCLYLSYNITKKYNIE